MRKNKSLYGGWYGAEQFPQMTRRLADKWEKEEEDARRAHDEARHAREQEERYLLAARDRVQVCEMYYVDELIDPTRPW